MVNRTRVKKAVDQQYGEGTFADILAGIKILSINGETYSVEEISEKNIYVREDAEVVVKNKVVPKPVAPPVKTMTDTEFTAELERRIGKDRLADVKAGTAVLAFNGVQVCKKDLTDDSLYAKLNDATKLLVIKAACGG